MTAKYMKVSIFPLQSQTSEEMIFSLPFDSKRNYYISRNESGDKLLELQAMESLADITTAITTTEAVKVKLASILLGDVQSEYLTLIDDPLNRNEAGLPEADVIQLRHIEVLPAKYSEYRQWRDGTIFEVVRSNQRVIKSFGAYHSIISTRPGVTFIAAVDKQHLAQFDEAFTNRHYADILVDAGNNYIIGGTEKGLNTHYFHALHRQPLRAAV